MEFALSIDRGEPLVVDGPDRATLQAHHEMLNPGKSVAIKKMTTLANGVRLIIPNYISNSAFQKFWKDPEEYLLGYCLFNPPPRFVQSYQMMFGSAFDGYVKNYLVERLHDKTAPEFQLPQIILDQCDKQFTTPGYSTVANGKVVEYEEEFDAFKWGKHLLDQYIESGTMTDMMLILKDAAEKPRFEFTVESGFKGHVAVDKNDEDVDFVMLGKPDLYFFNKKGAHVILDFKCNSIYTSKKTSPSKGYIMVRDGWKDGSDKHSLRNNQPHKQAHILSEGGIQCNYGENFEDINASWCDQTVGYSWMMGTPVGGTMVAGIHQLVGQALQGTKLPNITIAQHHYSVSKKYQLALYAKYKKMWDCLQTGHIFQDLSREDNDKKVAELNAVFGMKYKEGTKEAWLAKILRKPKYFG